MNEKTNKELFNEYFITKDKNIREKIINQNIGLVNFVTSKYTTATGIEINELNSYGYEGLLIAVDKYDPKLGYMFSTFAVSYITNYVRIGIREIKGFNTAKQYYSDFMKCYNDVIKYYNEGFDKEITVLDDALIVDEILKLMVSKGYINEDDVKFMKNKIYLNNCETVEEYLDLISSFDINEIVDNNILKEKINNMLHELNPRQEQIIRDRYGFTDGTIKKYHEIGEKYKISGARVYQIEKSALKRLSHHTRKKKLKDYY